MPQMVDLEKLTSGSNLLKQSRLHGDLNLNVSKLFTQRVAELATMKRLMSVVLVQIEKEKPQI